MHERSSLSHWWVLDDIAKLLLLVCERSLHLNVAWRRKSSQMYKGAIHVSIVHKHDQTSELPGRQYRHLSASPKVTDYYPKSGCLLRNCPRTRSPLLVRWLSGRKRLLSKPDDLSWVRPTEEGKNQLPKVVFLISTCMSMTMYPNMSVCVHTCMYAYTHLH